MGFKDLKQKPLTIVQKKAFMKWIDKDRLLKASAKERMLKELFRVKVKRSRK